MLVLVDFRTNAHSSVYDWKLIFGWQINYAHIKAFLVMQSCGISPEGMLPRDRKTDEPMNSVPKYSGSPTLKQKKEEPCVIETPSNEETVLNPSTEEIPISVKRQKVYELDEESRVPAKATESSLVEWLKNNDGVREMKSQIKCFSLMQIFSSSLCICSYMVQMKKNAIWFDNAGYTYQYDGAL